ncbi:MAG: hypothetical protein A2Y14_04030 [Verrucomicrobia bacterium GWF2_51_19]|nr:MAG: hypothetical protein A2Y14_04030 [Verrucomicrobia bacterium GWF2_51_19]HCJ11670.1 hypothetical protein [Opitutae bacterium]
METLKQYLATLKNTLGLDKLELNDDNQTYLLFDDIILVQITYKDDDSVELLAKLGVVDADNEALYQRIMEANLFWNGTEGAILSMDPVSQSIELVRRELMPDIPDYKFFEKRIESFVNVAEHWIKTIAEESGSEANAAVGMQI